MKRTFFFPTGFQFSHLDGFYGGNCGGFAGGTQMAESALQPEKTQEQQQQQQQEIPTSLTTKQQLLHIGEYQISSSNFCCPVWNALL